MAYVDTAVAETSSNRAMLDNFAPPDCQKQGRREAFTSR
jgi:hypothetical protein